MSHARSSLAVVALIVALIAGNPAKAAGLETLLMPGKVAAAHAKLEQDCAQCHDRANRDRQPALCMNCHKDVGTDVAGHTGFHGRIPGIDGSQCKACHSEHLGRDADIVKMSRPAFNHALTDFALTGAHSAAGCDACHSRGKKYREAPPRCVDCHRADEPHGGKLGADCGACHETATWARARFDHARTRFALRERHTEATCAACHAGNRFAGTPTQCASCHAPDDVHRGARGTDCASCHNTAGWKTTKFDHARETGFALGGAHARLDCKGCHTTPNLKDPLPRQCAGCHRKADPHANRFGDACEKCHGTSAWKPATFNHARDGHFELLGKHAPLDCHACHTGVVAQQKLGTDCHACHRTRDVHSGRLGTDCARCHGVEEWRANVAFDHDLTEFPLVGLHVAAPCYACHTSPAYKGAPQDCHGCHQRDDKHKGSLGKDCEACHSPNGWGLWEFDHAKATGFALVGAHTRATCEGCHKRPPDVVKLAGDCASCHAQDDVHLGQFGRQCQRCHGSVTFKGARMQ
jgi:hypothetical protein